MKSSLRENIRNKLRPLVAGFVLCCSLLTGAAFAQSSGSGIVTGRVTNQATSGSLWQAVVQVKGTSISANTERDGTYRLTVPAGKQTVVVSYTGLNTVEQPVDVSANAASKLDFELTSDVYKLDTVTVSGIREGQSLAIQQQKAAANSKLVTAIDAYGNPSANPGELIQRLSEVTAEIVGSEVRGLFIRGMDPNYSVLQVDGHQMASSRGTSASREFQIEQMGTSNLEQVELIKAPRPEDSANSVAGFVNLISKRAFDTPRRQINLTLGTLWRHRESGANPFQDKLSLDPDVIAVGYSDAFAVSGSKEKNLGIAFNFSRRKSSTGQDEMGAGGSFLVGAAGLYFPTGSTEPISRSFGSGDFFYDAIATSMSLNVDYKLGDNGYIFLRTARTKNNQYQRFYRWDIRANANAAAFTANSTSQYSTAVANKDSFAEVQSALFDKISDNYSINPGLSLKLLDHTAQLDASLFYSHANIEYPNYNTGRATTQAVEPGGLGWSLDWRDRDPNEPLFAQTTGASVYSPASYTPDLNQHIEWSAPSTLKDGSVNFTKQFSGGLPFKFKTGVKYVINSQDQYREWENRTRWTGPTGIAPFMGAHYNQDGNRYGPFPFLDFPGSGGPADILSSSNLSVSDFDAYTNYVNSTAADAEFEERITAGYVQGDFRFGHLRVLAGLRFEQTDTEANAFINNGDPSLAFNAALTREQNLARARSRFSPIKTKGSYDNVFPGVHLTYTAPWDLQFRASYNKSITRPPIANTLPITNYRPELSPPTVSLGNPDLKPYTSDNYEVSVEKYFEPVGKFTVGAFYKDLTNYFTTFISTVGTGANNGFEGQFAGATLSQVRNIGAGKIRGVSVDYSQQFSNLPGLLSGLGVMANYTRLRAEGQFTPNTTNTANYSTLPGLVPKSGNFGLFYKLRGLELRLLANYRSKFIIVTPAENIASVANTKYRESRTLLDFKGSYRFNPRYTVYFDVYNLTDEPTLTQSVAGRQTYTLKQGVSLSAGVNIRL